VMDEVCGRVVLKVYYLVIFLIVRCVIDQVMVVVMVMVMVMVVVMVLVVMLVVAVMVVAAVMVVVSVVVVVPVVVVGCVGVREGARDCMRVRGGAWGKACFVFARVSYSVPQGPLSLRWGSR